MQEIGCIDLIYPCKVLIYYSNLEVIAEKTLTGDIEFASFLGALSANESISISYALSMTLADNIKTIRHFNKNNKS